jgi:hypothetical protein
MRYGLMANGAKGSGGRVKVDFRAAAVGVLLLLDFSLFAALSLLLLLVKTRQFALALTESGK